MSDEYNYLKKHARWATDWPIAKLLGSATYAQLHDNAPGLFEPFPDWRSKGNSSSSIKTFFDDRHMGVLWNRRPGMPCEKYNHVNCVLKNKGISCNTHDTCIPGVYNFVEDKVPGPPNLVSTVLLEGELSPLKLKCLLIEAVKNNSVDPRIEPLVRSSTSYCSPELTPGEIMFNTVLITVLVLLVIILIRNFIIN